MSAVGGYFPGTEWPAPRSPAADATPRRLPLDLTGLDFGALHVVAREGNSPHGRRLFRAVCRAELGGCGAEVVRPRRFFARRRTRHDADCGCRALPRGRRALTFGVVTRSLSDWVREMRARGVELTRWAVEKRIDCWGWTVERALTTPVTRRCGT